MTGGNYMNSSCKRCGEWVWKGDGVWHLGWVYCRACWHFIRKETGR